MTKEEEKKYEEVKELKEEIKKLEGVLHLRGRCGPDELS